MSFLLFDGLPTWAKLISLGGHLAAGIMLGVLYFRGLWWNARLFAGGGRATTTIALMVGRFVLLGSLLLLASLEGALPLLLIALGVFIARSTVISKVQELAP